MRQDEILVINKPVGWTSNDVVQKIKGLMRRADPSAGKIKVGHAGTLDPLADGVLLVLVGAATKKQAELMKQPKEYLATVTFGEERDTYDAEGQITAQAEQGVIHTLTADKIAALLPQFTGEIMQKVPAFSAVKIEGKRLYDLARREKAPAEKDLPVKKIQIYELELLEFKSGRNGELPQAKLKIICSSGTYVRSLAHDLGRALNTGGFVSQLTRTRIGNYTLEQAQTVDEFEQSLAN